MKKSSRLHYIQQALKVLLPLAFGLGVIWFIMHQVDTDRVVETVRRGVHWEWVLVSYALVVASDVARAVRWRMQLRTVGSNLSVHEMTVSVFGGYGLNLVFPRLGELWRCTYVATRSGIPFTTTVGTMISERTCDMLLMGGIAVVAFILQSHVFLAFFATQGELGTDMLGGCDPMLIVVGVALTAGALWLSRRWLSRLSAVRYVAMLLAGLWDGVLSLVRMPHFWPYAVWSVVIWALYFVGQWIQFLFLDCTAHLGLLAALSVLTMGSLSLLAPVQGGLGAWHVMVIFTLRCYGVSEVEATTFALVSWVLEQGFVLLLGGYAMVCTMMGRRSAQTTPPAGTPIS